MYVGGISSSSRVNPVTPTEPSSSDFEKREGLGQRQPRTKEDARTASAPAATLDVTGGMSTQQFLQLNAIGQERQKRLIAARPGQAVDMYVAVLVL
jgi:hypothetical protein